MNDARTPRRTAARPEASTRGIRSHLLASARPFACASALLVVAACRGREPAQAAATVENDVPVVINSGSPFRYPPDLYDRSVEGQVRLRLYVDSAGRVQSESTRVASSSGTPGLDSAALERLDAEALGDKHNRLVT